MSEPTILLNRAFDDSITSPDKFGTPLVLGEIGFLTYATSSNPTNEVLSSTTDAGAGHVFSANASSGVTVSLTAGTLTALRGGTVELVLELTNVTAASNSAVIAFILQKNSAALTNDKRIAWTNAAAVLPGIAGRTSARITCVAGDVFRAVFTGSVGGIVTVGQGSLSLRMLADIAPPAQTKV